MGVPPNHQFLFEIFPWKPSISGYPHDYGNNSRLSVPQVQAKIMELSQLPSNSGAAGDYGNVRYLAFGSPGLRKVGRKSNQNF